MPIGSVNVGGLSDADARLAIAIHRTVLQRWLTLDHLVSLFLKRPLRKLEPAMQAVLLSGAAQLVFMHRLPAYAVVSESVALAKRRVRPGAGGMANAVLRKVAELVENAIPDQPWEPAEDRLPFETGCIALAEPCLPATGKLVEHLAVATSHPTRLVQAWLEQFGKDTAIQLAVHGTLSPPTVVQPENETWTGTHEDLLTHLAADLARRVQDATARQAVDATADLEPQPTVIYDACAGKGTKTRQLVSVHPSATIHATDPDPGRSRALADVVDQLDRATPEPPAPGTVDLLVLDVPCSNTGVLARRPEARYRITRRSIRELVQLQRQIVEEHLPTLRPGGHVLYTTCSIDPGENQLQAQWLVQRTGGRLIREHVTLPSGTLQPYHDGGYHALIVLPES